MSVDSLATALGESTVGTALRESLYIFPLLEGVHLLGLALSFGLIFFTDLRLIGVFMPHIPVATVLRQLRIPIFIGFALTFATGFLLFWAGAESLVHNPAFLAKCVAMLIALANAVVFEIKWGRHGAAWAELPALPAGARLAGWTSLGFWTAVTVSGRLIPYFADGGPQ